MATINKFTPIHDNVFVEDLDHGAHLTKHGIIILDDDMSERGIHARWGKVYCVGPKVEDLKVGEWILVEHGRWTNGMTIQDEDGDKKVWRIDYPAAVLLATDKDPRDKVQSNSHGLKIKHSHA